MALPCLSTDKPRHRVGASRFDGTRSLVFIYGRKYRVEDVGMGVLDIG